AAPTVRVKVTADTQPDNLSPINNNIHYESDPLVVPAAQSAVTVTLKQQSRKVTIQTKDTVLTADKVLKELSGEVSGSGGGKLYEINASVAAKIAGKYSNEVTNTTG